MKNFKLILRSLLSNNACIDGGRKKKWYFAVVMFVLSMVISIVPSFVKSAKTQGDDTFSSYSYGAREATMAFSQELNTNPNIKMIVRQNETSEGKYLSVTGFEEFDHLNAAGEIDFKFTYTATATEDYINTVQGDGKVSFIIFTQGELYIHIVNQESKEAIKNISCLNAYKYMEDGFDLKTMLVYDAAKPTESIEATWSNWKSFIRKAYNYNRITGMWQTAALMGGINVVITLLMGFMLWILTRGKNNPYRYFKIWECFKTSGWCTVSPALLTCGLGFLLTNFANVLFPLLIGVRVMWLSMKSLRPDGSGYPIEQ